MWLKMGSMGNRNSKVDAGAGAYAHKWEKAGVALEAERLRELRALSELEAARRFARLLSGPLPYSLRPGSGLVEQQRIFSRIRHTAP